MEKRCENCVYFCDKGVVFFECRKNPPVPAIPGAYTNFARIWPQIHKDDWCGDHKSKEGE